MMKIMFSLFAIFLTISTLLPTLHSHAMVGTSSEQVLIEAAEVKQNDTLFIRSILPLFHSLLVVTESSAIKRMIPQDERFIQTHPVLDCHLPNAPPALA